MYALSSELKSDMYVSFVQDSVDMLNKILIESNFATQMSALYHADSQSNLLNKKFLFKFILFFLIIIIKSNF